MPNPQKECSNNGELQCPELNYTKIDNHILNLHKNTMCFFYWFLSVSSPNGIHTLQMGKFGRS